MFKNLRELIASMPDESQCREYLIDQRWPDGKVICPYCDCGKVYRIKERSRFICSSKECGKKFSVTVGTFFQDSKIPIKKWLTALYLSTAHKKGISSYQLGRDIGVSQKCAWFMLHRIRGIMTKPLTRKLDNVVEADETHIGGSISNKHWQYRKDFIENERNWKENKTTALGILERNGELLLRVIDSHEVKQIQKTVRENIEFAATLITDESNTYNPLNDTYYHHSVNHSRQEYVRGLFHTNSVEGSFSHLKRMVYGIYHQISPKHCQRYLEEFMYRYNSRKMKDADRFTMSLSRIEGRLDYKTLVAAKAPIYVPPKVNRKNKPVMQLQGDEVIATFPSIIEASKAVGVKPDYISLCARGLRKKAGGYKWEMA